PSLPPGSRHRDRRRQALPVRGLALDLPHHVHARDHAPEGGEALAVGVALASEVQLRLVPDADEEVGGRGGAPVAGRPDRAVGGVGGGGVGAGCPSWAGAGGGGSPWGGGGVAAPPARPRSGPSFPAGCRGGPCGGNGRPRSTRRPRSEGSSLPSWVRARRRRR